jgi:glucose-induced degradation protein 4
MYMGSEDLRAFEQPDGEKEVSESTTSEERIEGTSIKAQEIEAVLPLNEICGPDTTVSLVDSFTVLPAEDGKNEWEAEINPAAANQLATPSPTLSHLSISSVVPPPRRFDPNAGIPCIDRELTRSALKPWEFSKRRTPNSYPSALFQPNSRYTGFQQSDRQIYNVDVTILTVDMSQCTTSGYLQICGLTPNHPTLTTFFTGEIIGGPGQRYSFRTATAEWGATDKTDMTHWARFPAWRSLSSQAKQNLNFLHPSDQSPWWEQENIFMRWKEHFLVPDYKLKSIQGASFEGFYYICLNQVEGKISGIYFHSKSEK